MGSDVNFLFEMGNIRLIDRMWRRFHFKDSANVAEHHFRVFWIAMVIAAREAKNYPKLDTGKIAKMCLLHDITESRTAEVDYISRQYTERNEEMAIQDILADTSVETEMFALWQEYEARKTIEAKIAKDADNLDVDMELAEQAATGNQLKETFRPTREFVAQNKLFTEPAKQLFKQIQVTNPHDWHVSSPRNRKNGGDWKK